MSYFSALNLPQGAGLGLALGAQGLSAFAGSQSAQIQGAAQAAALDLNAGIERERQGFIAQAGREEERRQRRLARLAAGRNRAAIGGSGLAMEGQRLDILRHDAITAELDALQIRENTAREIRASKQQELVDRFQAKQTKKQAKISSREALLNGVLGAANTYALATGYS